MTTRTTLLALAERVFRHGFSDGWRSNQTGRQSEPLAASGAWHFYVADGALQKSVEANPPTPATDTPGTYGTMTPTIEVVPPHYPLATEDREAVARAMQQTPVYRGEPVVPWDDTDAAAKKRYRDLADAALSALAPIRAAEILAAEANERARIVAWLRDLARARSISGFPAEGAAIAFAADRLNLDEHGAGK